MVDEVAINAESESPKPNLHRQTSLALIMNRFPSIGKRDSGVTRLIANATRRASLATISAMRQLVPKSIIYQLPEEKGETD